MKKVIKLDIDGVIRSMTKSMVDVYNKEFNAHMTEDDVIYYQIHKSFPLLNKDNAFDFFFNKHKQETIIDSEIYDGAKEAIDMLRSYDFYINIVTYQPDIQAKLDTLQWLDRHNVKYDAITFVDTHSKDDIKGDIIIDDCPDFLKEDYNKPMEVICIDKAYNRKDNICTKRFNSLMEAAKYLCGWEE